VRVHPRRQIVSAIVAFVTAGLRTPGVSVQLARTAGARAGSSTRGAAAPWQRRDQQAHARSEQHELDERDAHAFNGTNARPLRKECGREGANLLLDATVERRPQRRHDLPERRAFRHEGDGPGRGGL